jgi:hypothetical protein
MDERVQPRSVEKNANEARQGVTGHNVRYVLLTATVSVILLFIAVGIYYSQ